MAPPAPCLEWKEVVNYAFISEFDLLRHMYSHGDVSTSHWAVPAHREILSKFFKIKSARSELLRLDIETARLEASIFDERKQLTAFSKDLAATEPLLAAEISSTCSLREKTDAVHLARLESIKTLQQIAKKITAAIAVGSSPATELSAVERNEDGVDEHLEESVQDEMNRMTDFLEEAGLDRGIVSPTKGGVPVHMLHSWQI